MVTEYTLETRVGRLLEARVHAIGSLEEADAYSEAIRLEAIKQPRGVGVLCADHRPVAVYPPTVTDRLVQLFKLMNDHLERVAILVSPTNAVLLLQLQRIVREANFTRRRVVTSPAEALEHLRGGLPTAQERARAEAFVREWPPGEG